MNGTFHYTIISSTGILFELTINLGLGDVLHEFGDPTVSDATAESKPTKVLCITLTTIHTLYVYLSPKW